MKALNIYYSQLGPRVVALVLYLLPLYNPSFWYYTYYLYITPHFGIIPPTSIQPHCGLQR